MPLFCLSVFSVLSVSVVMSLSLSLNPSVSRFLLRLFLLLALLPFPLFLHLFPLLCISVISNKYILVLHRQFRERDTCTPRTVN